MTIKRPSDVEDFDVVEQIDFATSYRRPQIEQQVVLDAGPIKEDILIRLRLARMLAVMKAEGYDLRMTQT